MTIEQCEQYQYQLKDIKNITREIDKLAEKKERLRTSVMCPSLNMDGMPHAHNATDTLANYMAGLEPIQKEIDALQTEIIEKTAESLLTRRNLRQTFDYLDETKAEVLKQRFLDGDAEFLRFATIAENMHFTDRYIRRIYKQAMAEIINF